MARCDLDFRHPKFLRSDDAALQAGLEALRELVAKDHKLSHWVSHPMPKYPQYQNKIWKWDFKPEGDKSGGRKGWRLYAYVENPGAHEPIRAVAFLYYDKSETPPGDHVKYLAGVLKKFLAQTVDVRIEEARFRQQTDSDGGVISLCNTCYETVIISADMAEVELAEATHECPGEPE